MSKLSHQQGNWLEWIRVSYQQMETPNLSFLILCLTPHSITIANMGNRTPLILLSASLSLHYHFQHRVRFFLKLLLMVAHSFEFRE